MAATIDHTPKSPTGNSYCSLAEAEAYFETRLHAARWASASDDEKRRALIMATRHLDQHGKWIGTRTTTTQALEWPRPDVLNRSGDAYFDADTYPAWLRDITAEQAEFELRGERDADPGTRGLEGVTLPGPVKIEFDKEQAAVQRVLAETVWVAIEPYTVNRSPGPDALRMVGIQR